LIGLDVRVVGRWEENFTEEPVYLHLDLEGAGEDGAAILPQDLLKPVPLGIELGVHAQGFAGFDGDPRIVGRNVLSFFHNRSVYGPDAKRRTAGSTHETANQVSSVRSPIRKLVLDGMRALDSSQAAIRTA
jgi:hypothetical protein